jgi:HK97 gp10 family phage protein
MKVRMKVEGGDKLARKLQMIAEEYQRKHMRECALAAAEVIRQETEDNAPVDRGILKSDIQKEVRKQTKAKVDVFVGPGKTGWYAYFVEMGHAYVPKGMAATARKLRKAAKKAGRTFTGVKMVPPHPFLGPAFERKTDEAEDVFAKELRRRLRL